MDQTDSEKLPQFASTLQNLHTQPLLRRPAFVVGHTDEKVIVAFVV
jgi:hypothetical protein